METLHLNNVICVYKLFKYNSMYNIKWVSIVL